MTILNRLNNQVALAVALVVVTIGVAYLISSVGMLVGLAVVGGILGVILVWVTMANFRWGFIIVFLLGVFMFYLNRIYLSPIPLGIVYDALLGLVFISLIFTKEKNRVPWNSVLNGTTYWFIILTSYLLLQALNPNAVSIKGWVMSLRGNITIVLYVVSLHFIARRQDVRLFTKFWLITGFLVGLYGVYQEVFGLTSFEWDWIYDAPKRFKLYFIWNHMRKFSFLSDPSSYGMYTAASGLSFLVLAMGPFKAPWRIAFALSAVMIFVAMSFSGTRTAYAVVVAGVVFYLLLTIRTRRTMIIGGAVVLMGLAILFGPFHGGTINRIRSTFTPSEDASMGVRDQTRTRMQPYVRTHPIGGGPMTTGPAGSMYSPGHELAGDWDPDSGYLAVALETGWIGLILFMGLIVSVCLKGISAYYALKSQENKAYLLSYLVPFFALSVAHFTQDAILQRSIVLIVMFTYALVERIGAIDGASTQNTKINSTIS